MIEQTKEGYIIKEVRGTRPLWDFPVIAVLFPRIYRIIMAVLGRRTAVGKPSESKVKITEIRRTEEGWQILEYG